MWAGYQYFLQYRSACAIPYIHRIRLWETAKPTKMIQYLSKVVCQHFLNWFVGETFKILILSFVKKHISSIFWVLWNLVYRRYTQCIGEFATGTDWRVVCNKRKTRHENSGNGMHGSLPVDQHKHCNSLLGLAENLYYITVCPALVSGHFWQFWIIEHQMILYMYDLRSIFYYEYIH